MIICIAEDRPDCADAVKFLVLSLSKHCPGVRVQLFCPFADGDFIKWISGKKNVNLDANPLAGAYGWNTKPHALLKILETSDDAVVWVDSDIIVTWDFRQRIIDLPVATIVVAEEARGGAYDDTGAWRAQRWGFDVGRVLPHALNSCIVRVTRAHVPLLVRWRDLLHSDAYTAAQRMDAATRPWHFFTDQDVLTALLCSKEYSDIPINIISRGREIVQYYDLFGYSVWERVFHVFIGPPLFVHAQGLKPWRSYAGAGSLRQSFAGLMLSLSPCNLEAARYKKEIDRPWMYPKGKLARFFHAIGFGYAPLVGLPVAIVLDLWRVVRPLRWYAYSKFRKAPASAP